MIFNSPILTDYLSLTATGELLTVRALQRRTGVSETQPNTSTGAVPTVSDLVRRTGVSETQLDTVIIEHDLYNLAGCFDNVDTYLDKLGLSPPQHSDIKDLAVRRGTQAGMCEALRLWRRPNPYRATFR